MDDNYKKEYNDIKENDENNIIIADYSYYSWLKNKDYTEYCKKQLTKIYNDYFNAIDVKTKNKIYKELETYLIIVCDVIAYRYLMKHYTNLFYKLSITIEEYLAYKADRLLKTIKNKKEKIDNILSYVYMSFYLTSPRLIYDYAEKIEHCILKKKEALPYYLVARQKFFNDLNNNINNNNAETKEFTEHVILNIDNIYLDNKQEQDVTTSNIDRYAYSKWQTAEQNTDEEISESIISYLINKVENTTISENNEYEIENQSVTKSKLYLMSLFTEWKNKNELDYIKIKQEKYNSDKSFSIIDYIRYKYENNQLEGINYENYLNILKLLNSIIKN